MNQKLINTQDGSHTLYVEELDEHYHSTNGAITESKHIFVEAGLKSIIGDHIDILEMGFGTGLNAFLTLLEIRKATRTVHYTAIEKYPLGTEIIESLNYASFFEEGRDGKIFKLLHKVPWNEPVEITEGFILEKIMTDFRTLDVLDRFNLVYYDAFGPDKQPELWSPEIFNRLYRSMRSGATLTTYSSKGQVRRDMAGAGFRVEKLPGPPGKRDMTRAWKD